MHILDIAENSLRAGASLIRIGIIADVAADKLTVTIVDNGSGMSKEMLDRVRSPFATTRTTRKVGLGIPLFAAGCEATGGQLNIDSALGAGTTLSAVYGYSHIDRPPLGSIAETIAALVLANPEIDFVFTASKDTIFEFDTRYVKITLEGVAITEPAVMSFIREYLVEGTMQVSGGHDI